MVQSAEGRGHLVLRADRLAEKLLFDVDAFGGQLPLTDHPPFQRVQGVQQPDGKSRTGPHAAAGRQVAVVVDFHALRAIPRYFKASRTEGCETSSTVWQFSIFEYTTRMRCSKKGGR